MSNEIKHYRLLNEGEEIKPDDEYYNGSKWHPCGPPIKGYENVTYRHSPIRRDTASEETWLPIESAPKSLNRGCFLATNNLHAKDSFGNYSHRWLVNSVYHDAKLGWCGWVMGATATVKCLSHWLKINEPLTRAEAELKGGKV